MARLLVATVPLTGHVQPMLLVVRGLVARGHHVTWYAASKFRPRIEAAGATFAPMQRARDWDDAQIETAFPALRGKRGLSRVKTQLVEMFIASMGDQLGDLEAIAQPAPVDAILADQAHLGAAAFAEKHHVPWIQLAISALGLPSLDTAPFGSARRPPRPNEPRWIYRFLNWLIFRIVFRTVNRAYQAERIAAGLSPTRGTYFEVISPELYLQPTVRSFEYPRRDLPSQVRFIGPLVPRASSASALPAWWADVAAAHAAGTPIVLVTQGTLATDPQELIAPTLAALAGEPLLVIATTPGHLDAPANARIAPFIAYQELLPLVSVMVTNGGYGGVQMALSYGVPLVVAGGSEEKPEIAARVAWSGTGIDLRTGRPNPAALRTAVRRVLDEPAFAARARAIADEMSRHDAVREGIDAIEAVIPASMRAAS
ncbi:MAG: nucleotide disphospho-sugar-binding domain-containing protein [Kofleriaceae bacterium]